MSSDNAAPTQAPAVGTGLATGTDPGARALAAFAAQRRRSWRRYLSSLLVVAVVLAGGIWFVLRHSEIGAVTSRTTTVPAVPLPAAQLAGRLTRTWSATDRMAAGDPISQDVLVTYSEHAVTGRDIRTGAARWSYTRSNRSICAVDVQDSVAVAVYSNRGLCDEVTGLRTDSGQRAFVRTLTLDAVPSTLRLASIPGYLAIIAPDGIELISPGDRSVPGVDFWLDEQGSGCSTISAALGSAGVLIASHCGTGDTLSLRTLGNKSGRDWTVPLAGRVPLAAAEQVVTLSGDGRAIQYLGASKGALLASSPLAQQVSGPAVARSVDLGGSADYLVEVAGGYLALRGTHLLHQGAGVATTTLGQAAVLVAGTDQVRTIAYATGQVTQVRPVRGVTPATTLAVAEGYLAAGAGDGVSVYQ